jgi:von Willebrand factor type A domain
MNHQSLRVGPILVIPTNPFAQNQLSKDNPFSGREPNRPANRGSAWSSYFVSILVHVNVLLILAMTFRAFQEAETPSVNIDTTFTLGEEQDNVIAAELPNEVLMEKEAVFSDAAPLSAMETLHPERDLPGLKAFSGASGLGGLGAGGGGVGFFGTTARGRSFVFVVDCSGSMQGSRFERAISELRKSLEQLNPNQKFQIVFFNDQALPLVHSQYATHLMPATRSVLTEVFGWIEHRQANGGTFPDEALKLALGLKPDVIFFLTDADRVPRQVRTLIAENNKYNSTVHTIAFGHRGGETLMQGIAADHHGRYRFVP